MEQTTKNTNILYRGYKNSHGHFVLFEADEILIHDAENPIAPNRILETYFTDVQKLFSEKVSALGIETVFGIEEENQLRALFEEMLSVKLLLQDENIK